METEEYKGYTIEIRQDEDPMDPREWDNLGEMIAYHRDYTLGDHGRKRDMSWRAEDAKERVIELAEAEGMKIKEDPYNERVHGDDDLVQRATDFIIKRGGVILPLYLLDHSGIWMRTGRFAEDSGGWDTSMVGYIIATPERIRKEYGAKRITKAIREKAARVLENEVSVYSKYISGEFCAFVVEKDGEHVDSCGGYEDYSDAVEAAREAIDADISHRLAEHLKRKKTEIIKHVPLEKRTALA